MPRARRLLPLCFATLPLHAALTGPYGPDADTVHLFHLDEAAGETVAANAVAGTPAAIAFDGGPVLNHASNPLPADTGILGTAGPAGFGKAASISAADLGIVASTSEATTGRVRGPLVIGNEARLTGNSSEGLLGRVDEVRVSMVTRDDAGDNGISISHSLPKALDPDRRVWIEFVEGGS